MADNTKDLIDQSNNEGQYKAGPVPYHVHMGTDSPFVSLNNIQGFPSSTPATSGYFLESQGVGTNPIWAVVNSFPSAVQGDILYYNGTAWVVLAPGSSGQILQTKGASANPVWANTQLPAASQGDIPYYGASSAWNTLGYGTAGQFLETGGFASPNPYWGQPILTGTMFLYVTGTTPTGYLPCNGNAVSRSTYSALFAVIGVSFGSGNGTTTFNVPNLTAPAITWYIIKT